MGTITNFEDLEIWQTARQLANRVFLLTQKDPFAKDFRFRDQIRASSGSVMDNIAEGLRGRADSNMSTFYPLQKDRQVKQDRSCTGPLTKLTLIKMWDKN